MEALGGITAGATTRFVFTTSGSNAEAYLSRPTGSGPFPLMIFLHGHTLGPMGGAASVVPEAEAFEKIFFRLVRVSHPKRRVVKRLAQREMRGGVR